MTATPWVLAAAGVVAALVLTWAAAIIATVQHFPGLGARARVLRLFAPGQVLWALAVLAGVGLLILAQRSSSSAGAASAAPAGAGGRAASADLLPVLLGALFVAACAVGTASVVNAIVELTFAGDSLNAAFNGFFQDLAALPIAASAALWALHAMPRHRASGGPSA